MSIFYQKFHIVYTNNTLFFCFSFKNIEFFVLAKKCPPYLGVQLRPCFSRLSHKIYTFKIYTTKFIPQNLYYTKFILLKFILHEIYTKKIYTTRNLYFLKILVYYHDLLVHYDLLFIVNSKSECNRVSDFDSLASRS